MTSTSTVENYPQLLSLAVHEFRTPASVVGGYLRMIQRDKDTPLHERHRKMIEEADKSCARLVSLITELSDISKLDAGLLALAQQPVDVFTLIGDLAEHVHEARDRDVHLAIRGNAAGASIAGDATRLRAAFDAIFRAVLREKSGPATVVVERKLASVEGRSRAVVVVADEASVQQAYETAPGVFDEKRGGLGLALPLARRVIERHGGRIWAPEGELARSALLVSIPL